jgi:hypothetical protein
MKNRAIKHSDNWETPSYIYDPLNDEFNFNHDPCPIHYGDITPDKDGLLQSWGSRSFVNPPYSRKLKEAFVARGVAYMEEGFLSVFLLPVSTSTQLFHKVIQPNASEIRFIEKRVRFIGHNALGMKVSGKTGMHDSMIVVFDGRRDSV